MNTMYIITGAAGYLGSNVARQLSERGERIRALVMPGDPAARQLPRDIEQVYGDLLDDAALTKLFSVPEDTEIIVLHIAGIVTIYPEFNQKVYDVNVTGTKNILRFCVTHKVKKLVYVSSSSAIPELPNKACQTEVSSFDPDKVIGFYAKTKAEATQAVLDAAKDGLDASVVFPTGICGPGDYAFGSMTQVMIDCANEKMPAGIAGGFNAGDVRDIARGIILCAENGRRGECYLFGGTDLSIKELFHEVHEQTGAREIKMMLPLWLVKATVPLYAIYYKMKKRPPIFTDVALYNLTRNNNYSRQKAEAELGFTVRPVKETIADTLTWLRDIGKITYRVR